LNHEFYMQRALELARRGEGRTRPNPPVGAVVVRDGKIVGEGFHPRAGEPHAEIFALRDAGEAAGGANLYVTLEPCCHHGKTGPCTEAVLAAGVARVFIGTLDPNPRVDGGGIASLRSAGIAVETGVLEAECRRLIAPFAKHVKTGVPYVILKSATTLDGRIASGTGDSRWISSEESREHVHRLRDRVDAIMVGIGTVLKDDPRLTTRLPEGGGRDADRIVVDARLQIPEDSSLLRIPSPAATLIATTSGAPAEKAARLRGQGVDVLELPENGKGGVDLCELMVRLGELGYQCLLLEGGARLNGAALRARIVDRIQLFIAPLLLGGDDGPSLAAGPGLATIAEAKRLQNVRISRFGDDTLIEGELDTSKTFTAKSAESNQNPQR
jgi:diaminohydroxyphosphoribosylaminopyrimidine deaminase / 5-amino-6-(5-phosphoribosylamino)uracil reductase